MRTVHEIVVKEELRYVAEDGKVFLREADCKGYEKELARADLKAKLDLIERCEEAEGRTPIDGAEYPEYHSYYWYRPKTREEANVIEEWYNVDTGIHSDEVGNWICIEESDDGYSWSIPIVCSIINVKELFGKLGYDVTIMKKEDSNV